MLPSVESGDIRALHRARVATRRLREILPVLQLDAKLLRKLTRHLRKVTSSLGTVRELDVLASLVGELQGEGRYDERALARVGTALQDQQARARRQLESELPIDDMRRVAARLGKAADELEEANARDEHAWHWAVEARIVRRAVTLDAALRDAGSVYVPERLHAVRVAAKKLRYALEISGEAGLKVARGDLGALKRCQDVLGRMHDLHLFVDRVREIQSTLVSPDIREWRQLDLLCSAVEDECRLFHARYMRQRPALGVLCARLGPRQGAPRVARRTAS
jgi:CHAD domain-containing protein